MIRWRCKTSKGRMFQLKKQMLLTLAASAALLVGNPATEKANAESITAYTQVHSHIKEINLDSFNDYINKLLTKYAPQEQNNQPEMIQPKSQETAVHQQPNAQQPAENKSEQADQSSYEVSIYERQVVNLMNQERAKYGLPELKIDLALSKVAREKSLDMQANNYFSHTSPTYGSPFNMMKQYGISYKSAGENIAKGQRTPEEVVQAWMNSDGHRKNILSANFTHIGVGYVAEGNYWTQQFIGK